MSKFAPEPWRIVSPGPKEARQKVGIRNDNGFICFLADVYRYPGQTKRYDEELQEQCDTAQLIKTAPKLLRALKRLDSFVTLMRIQSKEDPKDVISDQECKELWDLVKEAIAEAEGRQ